MIPMFLLILFALLALTLLISFVALVYFFVNFVLPAATAQAPVVYVV